MFYTFLKKNRTQAFVLMLLITIGISLFVPELVHATSADFGLQQVTDQGIGLSNQSLPLTITKIVRIVLGFLGLIAVVLVLYGGYVYMTAAGNEDKVAQAKLILRNALIGLAIIFFSFGIVQFAIIRLGRATGLDIAPTDPYVCTGVHCGPIPQCLDNHFAALSVTPTQTNTGMNNVVVRAVFTQGVGTLPENVLTISNGQQNITSQFAYQFVPGTNNTVLEAVYAGGVNGEHCAAEGYQGESDCFPEGTYTVSLSTYF
ncbi:MAG: hypothetical protein UW10_C0032G0001, partial [Candidatus Magasanikbacteria bacterium GW2011_GWA2_43_9]